MLTNENLKEGLEVRCILSSHYFYGKIGIVRKIDGSEDDTYGKYFHIQWKDNSRIEFWSIRNSYGLHCFELIPQEAEQENTKPCDKCGCYNKPETKCWYCDVSN